MGDLVFMTYIRESRRIDTNGERSYVRQTSSEFYTVRHGGKTKDSGTRREEMPSVIIGVEPDEIRIKDSKQDLAANGENSGYHVNKQLGASKYDTDL